MDGLVTYVIPFRAILKVVQILLIQFVLHIFIFVIVTNEFTS